MNIGPITLGYIIQKDAHYETVIIIIIDSLGKLPSPLVGVIATGDFYQPNLKVLLLDKV